MNLPIFVWNDQLVENLLLSYFVLGGSRDDWFDGDEKKKRGTYGYCHNDIPMTFQHLNDLPRLKIPNVDIIIFAS